MPKKKDEPLIPPETEIKVIGRDISWPEYREMEKKFNLPMKIFPVTPEANFIYKGDIDMEALLGELYKVDARQVAAYHHEARVNLSVWEDSGDAKKTDQWIMMGSTRRDRKPRGKSLHVYTPTEVRMINLSPKQLDTDTQKDTYFWKVAEWVGGSAIKEILPKSGLPPTMLAIATRYNDLKRLQRPQRFPFSINREVDV